jgi:hypothetical protein
MARLRTRWTDKERARSIKDVASAMSVNLWKIASEALLNLENEGFETTTNAQRLEIITEFAAFLVHMADRLLYEEYDEADRGRFVTALALDVIRIIEDNKRDVVGPGDYRDALIAHLNRRLEEYYEYPFDEKEGPGFGMRRRLGEYVRDLMGERDRKWIPDYVIDREAPQAYAQLRRALKNLLSGRIADAPELPESGVWGEG